MVGPPITVGSKSLDWFIWLVPNQWRKSGGSQTVAPSKRVRRWFSSNNVNSQLTSCVLIRACDFAVNLPWHSCWSPISQTRPLFPLASGKKAMCLKTGNFPRSCFISWPEKMADSLDWWLWVSLRSGNVHDGHPLKVCDCVCPCHTIANYNSQLLLSVMLWCWWKYFSLFSLGMLLYLNLLAVWASQTSLESIIYRNVIKPHWAYI